MANTKAAKHKAIIHWEREPDGEESYRWTFDNGVVIHNAHHATLAQQGMIDPESAFIASVASCHMLSFLAQAVKRGFVVKRYLDEAFGVLEVNDDNRIAITRVLLRPEIEFSGNSQPDEEQIRELHQVTSQHCFIANSIKTVVHVEPVLNLVEQGQFD